MAMQDIENAFITEVKKISGLSDALPYEPQALPRNYPVVTLLFIGAPQEDVATGLVEVTWHWKVNLYISLNDYRKAQDDLKNLVPAILNVTRDNPLLSNTAEWVNLTDEEEEPIFASDDRYLLKRLDLRAKTTET